MPHHTFVGRVGARSRTGEPYRLRVSGEHGTAAATIRALVDSTDGKRFPAVGVGIFIETSWQPLVDDLGYGAAPRTLR